jgi:hypothetical protein
VAKERAIGDRKEVSLWDELHPNRWLKAGLLDGKQVTLTIETVYVEVMPGKTEGSKDDKAIMSFVGKDRELALNRTNSECLKAMFGPRVQEWKGKRVTLCTDQDRDPTSGGKCDCIRIAGSPDITENIEVSWVVHSPKGPRTNRRTLKPTAKRTQTEPKTTNETEQK